MSQQQVWEILAKIPIGTIIAWGVVLVTVIGVICAAVIKIYKVSVMLHDRKTQEQNTQARLARHDQQLDRIDASLQAIYSAMKKSIRHDIVLSCEAAIDDKKINAGQLRALEELYESYAEIGGNSYATTLMKKVRQLPVVGTIDD